MSEQPALLLVDDEANVLSSLTRLLRSDGYHIIRAGGGEEGLQLLSRHPVAVVVSDQRMPAMTGVQFLRKVHEQYPDTIRIVLSGYTDLQTITDAINAGAIYKFLTKPWDDAQLRSHVAEAFELYAKTQASKLHVARQLGEAEQSSKRMEGLLEHALTSERVSSTTLALAQEILELLPSPLLGISDDQQIVLSNQAAIQYFGGLANPGQSASQCLPAQVLALMQQDMPPGSKHMAHIETGIVGGELAHYTVARLGRWSQAHGFLVFIGAGA